MTTAKRAVFTDRYLKSLKPAEAGKRIVHWDAAKPSFGCRITDRGVVSFFVMRRMHGKPQPVRVVLGRYPDVSLARARRLATEALGDLVSGVHPKEREREQRLTEAKRQANTFAALADQFLRRPAAAKQRTASEIGKTINRHLIPRWGARVASEIKRRDVIAMIETIGAESGPYMAAKVLALASSIYRFGVTRELVESNPCHLIKPSDFVGEMAPRQRVLTDSEIALVWQATKGEIRRRNGTEIESTYPAGPFARFLLLTAVRRNEAARMTWAEVDLDNALWVIPGSALKAAPRMRFRSPAWPSTCFGRFLASAAATSCSRPPAAALRSRASASSRTPLMSASPSLRRPGWRTGASMICEDRADEPVIARRLAVHR